MESFTELCEARAITAMLHLEELRLEKLALPLYKQGSASKLSDKKCSPTQLLSSENQPFEDPLHLSQTRGVDLHQIPNSIPRANWEQAATLQRTNRLFQMSFMNNVPY